MELLSRGNLHYRLPNCASCGSVNWFLQKGRRKKKKCLSTIMSPKEEQCPVHFCAYLFKNFNVFYPSWRIDIRDLQSRIDSEFVL